MKDLERHFYMFILQARLTSRYVYMWIAKCEWFHRWWINHTLVLAWAESPTKKQENRFKRMNHNSTMLRKRWKKLAKLLSKIQIYYLIWKKCDVPCHRYPPALPPRPQTNHFGFRNPWGTKNILKMFDGCLLLLKVSTIARFDAAVILNSCDGTPEYQVNEQENYFTCGRKWRREETNAIIHLL